MKNRDRYINKVNEYDMLVDMNKRLMKDTDGEYCILCALPHKTYCYLLQGKSCDECIQTWLNEESR